MSENTASRPGLRISYKLSIGSYARSLDRWNTTFG